MITEYQKACWQIEDQQEIEELKDFIRDMSQRASKYLFTSNDKVYDILTNIINISRLKVIKLEKVYAERYRPDNKHATCSSLFGLN